MWFRGLYSYRYSFPKQCFLIADFASTSWASLQKFLKGKLAQVAHLHNAARALSSRSRCFQLSTNLRFLSLSLILWYKTNRMWLSVVCILIDNDTGHHSRQDLLHTCQPPEYKNLETTPKIFKVGTIFIRGPFFVGGGGISLFWVQ